jgi:hypothetical protein
MVEVAANSSRFASIAAWLNYTLCGSTLIIGLVDQAYGGLGLFFFFGVALIGVGFLALLVSLPRRWRAQHWRSLIPLLICPVVLPAIMILGPFALLARFRCHQDEYESIAAALKTEGRPEKLRADELHLAHWVKIMRVADLQEGNVVSRRNHSALDDAPPRADYLRVIGVHFGTVTHGFAGHRGFMRVFDAEAARVLNAGHGADGWTFSRPIADNWYLVAD